MRRAVLGSLATAALLYQVGSSAWLAGTSKNVPKGVMHTPSPDGFQHGVDFVQYEPWPDPGMPKSRGNNLLVLNGPHSAV